MEEEQGGSLDGVAEEAAEQVEFNYCFVIYLYNVITKENALVVADCRGVFLSLVERFLKLFVILRVLGIFFGRVVLYRIILNMSISRHS